MTLQDTPRSDEQELLAESRFSDHRDGEAIEPETGIVWSRFLVLLGLLAFLVVIGGPNMLVFLGALVGALVIHEAGHFFVARWSGMKVTEYFIGFGPRILSFRRGETLYGIKALPFGAYVRIIGMNNLDGIENPADEPRTYRKAAWHKRVLTILAGPATHFVMALGLMVVFLAVQGAPVPEDEGWGIGVVVPFSAAEEAGLQTFDQVVGIDGNDTTDFDALSGIISDVSGQEVDIDIIRNGEPQTFSATIGERLTASGADGYSGLYIGDLVVGFEGAPVANYDEFATLAEGRIGEQVEVDVVYRQELHTELITINSVPRVDAVEGFLGVSNGQLFEHLDTGEAFAQAPGEVGALISEIAERTPRLVTSVDGLRSLFGLTAFDDPEPAVSNEGVELRPFDANFDENRPVSLIGLTAIANTLEDLNTVLFLIILVNLFFGMFNLVPLLPLDGGHILLATYERIRSFFSRERYEADAAKLLPLTYAVAGLLLFISLIAMVRDIQDFVL